MGRKSIVKVKDVEFDLNGVLTVGTQWVTDHWVMLSIFIVVAFLFWIFQKDGFAVKLLDYFNRRKELNAKVEIDRETIRAKYGSSPKAGQLESHSPPLLPAPLKQLPQTRTRVGNRGRRS